ncbi:carboxymuconolactone decarboxylase family protein [Aspergillus saccharolyticus JOP 1030-1]|uniref:4-carboxymuconolactone decarboxylase family protein n=1 Tax=Aspergillus saccharolyticus JOP 1030-1 TaxID=1450539 RepID=A0A318ZA24_9EURO|nr:4-carboxymuconolactone decarboxylase family protein [Aspergillus saccharolyticus JOP 1030-1]PYH43287.1 4-carboxymuconolactone decarboxylase family protein [Aspergillus saccharolyticus JOP 1030-1]
MRLPYVANPPDVRDTEEAEILAQTQDRRAPGTLLPLDLALMHSFPITDGWNSFMGVIRTRTSLSTIIREMIMCRVAVLNDALFEWEQHAPLLRAGGFSEEAMEAIRHPEICPEVQERVLSQAESAVLKYTDAMTKTVRVPDAVFQEVKDHFDDKQVVEITATVAAYNCVSRFLVALDVGERNHGKCWHI